MRRVPVSARPDWRERVEAFGFLFHTVRDQPYWFEEVAYEFTEREVQVLERATNELHEMCLAAMQRILDRDELARLKIPELAWPAIRRSWDDDSPSVYGRFDLAFTGNGEPKLLEYNAATPTSLLEAADIQWQ